MRKVAIRVVAIAGGLVAVFLAGGACVGRGWAAGPGLAAPFL